MKQRQVGCVALLLCQRWAVRPAPQATAPLTRHRGRAGMNCVEDAFLPAAPETCLDSNFAFPYFPQQSFCEGMDRLSVAAHAQAPHLSCKLPVLGRRGMNHVRKSTKCALPKARRRPLKVDPGSRSWYS